MGGLGGNQNDRMEKRAEGVHMAKTIKQLADELGVSKTAVRKKIANLGLQTANQKIGNQIVVNSTVENALKSAFAQNGPQTKTANQTETKSETSLQLVSVLEILQNELEIKNKQISELNDRLAECSAALVAAQQTAQAAQALHAGTIQQQITAGGADPAEQVTPIKKKRWWNWK